MSELKFLQMLCADIEGSIEDADKQFIAASERMYAMAVAGTKLHELRNRVLGAIEIEKIVKLCLTGK